MLLVLSDTHGRTETRLEARTETALDAADVVCHCGDFMTEEVYDAFRKRVQETGGEFYAVAGNNDPSAVQEAAGDTRVVEHEGVRIALAHGHEHTDTSLALFGRQSNADLVCVGHSHEPGFEYYGAVPVLNPGSHADPRWHRPGHAEIQIEETRLTGEIREPNGETFERFEIER